MNSVERIQTPPVDYEAPPQDPPEINWSLILDNLAREDVTFSPFQTKKLRQMCVSLQDADYWGHVWRAGLWDPETRIMHIRREALPDHPLPYTLDVVGKHLHVVFKGKGRARLGSGFFKRVAYAIDLVSLCPFAHATLLLSDTENLPEAAARRTAVTEITAHQRLAEDERIVQLSYTHIYPAKKRGVGGEKLSLILEYCDQGELFSALFPRKHTYHPYQLLRLNLSATLSVLTDFFEGLATFQRHGLIYRDLKPSNLLLFEDEEGKLRLKFTDLGMTRTYAEAMELARAKRYCSGTTGYICPYYYAHTGKPDILENDEIIEKMCGHQNDIWSAGVILYLWLTGFPPQFPDNPVELMRCSQTAINSYVGSNLVRERTPPCLQLAPAEVREFLFRATQDMLQLDPSSRPFGQDLLEKWNDLLTDLPNGEIERVDLILKDSEAVTGLPPPKTGPVRPERNGLCVIL